MKHIDYRLEFVTPAFLGDAEQNGRWRTPPFKALLRQWWRVAAAGSCGFSEAALRDCEGELFGSAHAGGGRSNQSRVRIRLKEWRRGSMSMWNAGAAHVWHPEVGRNVDAHLYLGYGPLAYDRASRSTALKNGMKAAIKDGESARMRLAWPGSVKEIDTALQLVHWFGTVGGRSRNGWGSVAIADASIKGLTNVKQLQGVSRDLAHCLCIEWPHAIGRDANDLLVWKAGPFDTWSRAMAELASAKVGFRTAFGFANRERPHATVPADVPFEDRHLLAYPVTHHAVAGWSESSNSRLRYDRHGWVRQSNRLANQIRFKVLKDRQNHRDVYHALIFHLPCALPHVLSSKLCSLAPSQKQQIAIWQKVHQWLDSCATTFGRLP